MLNRDRLTALPGGGTGGHLSMALPHPPSPARPPDLTIGIPPLPRKPQDLTALRTAPAVSQGAALILSGDASPATAPAIRVDIPGEIPGAPPHPGEPSTLR